MLQNTPGGFSSWCTTSCLSINSFFAKHSYLAYWEMSLVGMHLQFCNENHQGKRAHFAEAEVTEDVAATGGFHTYEASTQF